MQVFVWNCEMVGPCADKQKEDGLPFCNPTQCSASVPQFKRHFVTILFYETVMPILLRGHVVQRPRRRIIFAHEGITHDKLKHKEVLHPRCQLQHDHKVRSPSYDSGLRSYLTIHRSACRRGLTYIMDSHQDQPRTGKSAPPSALRKDPTGVPWLIENHAVSLICNCGTLCILRYSHQMPRQGTPTIDWSPTWQLPIFSNWRH